MGGLVRGRADRRDVAAKSKSNWRDFGRTKLTQITPSLRLCWIHAFLYEQFYKNNEAQICPKFKNNVGTIQAGIWNHKCKVYFPL